MKQKHITALRQQFADFDFLQPGELDEAEDIQRAYDEMEAFRLSVGHDAMVARFKQLSAAFIVEPSAEALEALKKAHIERSMFANELPISNRLLSVMHGAIVRLVDERVRPWARP